MHMDASIGLEYPERQREGWARSCVGQSGDRQAIPSGIGDIKSNARGSGARYNTGKTPIELVPVSVIWWYESQQFEGAPTNAAYEALDVLKALGEWQSDSCNAGYVIGQMDDPWMDCAAVFDYGRQKYAEWNWAKGMPWSVPMACAVRHALAILRGEENDPESGLPHRGHMACNLVMLCQYELAYREGDDRPACLSVKQPGEPCAAG